MRFLLVCTLFLGALFGNAMCHGQELSEAERGQFLERMAQMRAKFPGVRSEFREEKQSKLLQKPLVSEGSLAFLAPNRFKREIRGANPSFMVCNGKVLWIYYPRFNEAERYTLGERAFFDDSLSALTAGLNFSHLEEYYNVRAFREDGGYRVVLAPKRSNFKRVMSELTVWLDGELLLHRSVLVLAKGDKVDTEYIHARRTSIPESEFEFEPPAGAKVSTPLGGGR